MGCSRKGVISIKTKNRVYESLVCTVLPYRCKTWQIKRSKTQTLNSFDHRCIKLILGHNLCDQVPNEIIRRLEQEFNLEIIICHQRLSSFHIACSRPNNSFFLGYWCKPFPGWRKGMDVGQNTGRTPSNKTLNPLVGPDDTAVDGSPHGLELLSL